MALRASPRSSLRTGLVVGLLAVILAHGYRGVYLLAGGSDFAEVNVLSTTLAAFVPTLLAAFAYGELAARTKRARWIFPAVVFAFAAFSAVPMMLAPLHPGFGALAAPLHLIVGAVASFGIPWHAGRAPASARVAGIAG